MSSARQGKERRVKELLGRQSERRKVVRGECVIDRANAFIRRGEPVQFFT